jgi:MoxR-like ATPase
MAAFPTSIEDTHKLLASAGYIADRALATVLFLSLKMGRPLFLEGEAGVGKTEIAKVLAATLERKLIRLQCYEGLDVASAVYEWNYAAQMVEIRLAEAAGGVERQALSRDIFTDRFLIKRPILQALEPDSAGAPILLIDELDRADEAFEAFLLEVLADNQVTVPELGTIRATEAPIVVVTTNRTREIHDALKRRCFYHWVDYPDAARELEIVTTRVPGVRARLAAEVVALSRSCGRRISSSGRAFRRLWIGRVRSPNSTRWRSIRLAFRIRSAVLLKYQDDIARLEGSRTKALLDQMRAERAAAE